MVKVDMRYSYSKDKFHIDIVQVKIYDFKGTTKEKDKIRKIRSKLKVN